MQVPAAMFIESALDSLQKFPKELEWILPDQLKELNSAVGSDTASRLGVSFPLSKEFQLGYQLGLQTARTILMMSPALTLKGIKLEEVL